MPAGETAAVTITRASSAAQVALMLEWAGREGWNPGRHDAAAFYAADPQGFWLTLEAGEPVACLSLVHDETRAFAFLGFYIVRPDRRGRGLGLALWNAALAAREAQTIGLDGVVDRQEDYRRSGFVLAHRNQRFCLAAEAPLPAAHRGAGEIVPLASLPVDALQTLDAAAYPGRRRAFLKEWLAQPESRAFGLARGGRLAGFGVIRRTLTGWKVAPLVAEDADGAEALFAALSEAAEGEAIYLDVPHLNPAALELARKLGMEPGFETARMYRGPAPVLDGQRLFGITSFELG